MPLYEYQCGQCGNIEEVIQKFSDAPLTTCQHCSGKLSKLISQSSFHLKGTGWYVTDYSKKSPAVSNEKDAVPKSSAEKKSNPGDATAKAAKSQD